MELMDMSLTKILEKLNKTLLPYIVAIDVMLQIGSGMWYLHDMHVAHLDLTLLQNTSFTTGFFNFYK